MKVIRIKYKLNGKIITLDIESERKISEVIESAFAEDIPINGEYISAEAIYL